MSQITEYTVQYLVIGDTRYKVNTHTLTTAQVYPKDQVGDILDKLKGVLHEQKLTIRDVIVVKLCKV